MTIFFANDLLEPVQVGAADDLKTAQSQMRQFAHEKPGWYFVWDPATLHVVARIDTTKPKLTPEIISDTLLLQSANE